MVNSVERDLEDDDRRERLVCPKRRCVYVSRIPLSLFPISKVVLVVNSGDERSINVHQLKDRDSIFTVQVGPALRTQ